MSLETDLIIDRRRLKKRLALWRIGTIVAVILLAIVAIGRSGVAPGGAYVARLNVRGIITEQPKLVEAIRALADNAAVKAVIVSIDSPGGAVAGGESLHGAILHVAGKKPVVAVMGGTAASAGYMIAMPAARVFAREATLTGSIGVILQTGEVSGLLRTLGVSAEAITSGALKDQPSMTKPMSAEGRAVLQGLVMDLYDQFVGMVAAGRHMEPARVRELADGRAYSGRQALKLGLVDAIGGEAEARAWLASEKGVSATLPVRNVKIGGLAADLWGEDAEGLFAGLIKNLLSQGLRLDGAWAVWQPGN